MSIYSRIIFIMKRDPYFDNLKFLLIMLVVVGHAVQPLISSISSAKLLYLAIYSFHMPLFAFVSGYFAKDFIQDRRAFKHIKKYLLLYLVFESACIALFYDSFLYLLIPTDHMWYLLSLLFWLMLLPFFSRSKHLVILAISLSLLVGYITNGSPILSTSRTVAFLPFFVLGYHAKKAGLIVPQANKYITTAIMLTVSACIYILSGLFDPKTLFCGAGSFGAGYRFVSLITAAIVSYCFMSIIPRRLTWFTTLGSKTLQVYIIHWPIIRLIEETGLFSIIGTPYTLIPLVAAAVVLSALLALIPLYKRGQYALYNSCGSQCNTP